MPQKATRATVRQRVEQLLRLRLRGAQFCDIRAFASENDPETGRPWRVSERQLWRYCGMADELLASQLEKSREKRLNWHIAARFEQYALANEAGDRSACIAVLKDLAELENLYPPKHTAPPTPQPNPWAAMLQLATDAELQILVSLHQRVDQRPEPIPVNGTSTNDTDNTDVAAPGSDPAGAVPPELPELRGLLPDPERDGRADS